MHHHLEGHKELTSHKDVLRLADPDVVWIPLVNGNAPCTPLVSVGDEVKVGTKIAERNDHFYLPLFSPVSGTHICLVPQNRHSKKCQRLPGRI